jgi:hypothetical protein
MADADACEFPEERPSKPRVTPLRHYDEDMDDSMDIASFEKRIEHGEIKLLPLYRAMCAIQNAVYEPFLEFDSVAIKMHNWYELVTGTAVFFGALSVVLAIAEATSSPGFTKKHHLTLAEFLAAAISLAAILLGLGANFKERWILARYKAERLRLLKFASLLVPSLWCEPPAFSKSERDLRRQVHCISELEYDDAERWAKRGVHPYAAKPPCSEEHSKAMDELIDHYVPKRIGAQLNYLETHWGRLEFRGRLTSIGVQIAYWISFIFVGCHLVVQRLTERGDIAANADAEWIGAILAFTALILPIFAAAARTFRAANEFERSVLRHKATYDSLNWLAAEIEDEPDRARKFVLIGFAETVLEADCREFIRLLSEAEWYG